MSTLFFNFTVNGLTSITESLSLLQIAPDGSSSLTPLRQDTSPQIPPPNFSFLGFFFLSPEIQGHVDSLEVGNFSPIAAGSAHHVIPDGQGGVLVPYSFTLENQSAPNPYERRVMHVVSGSVQYDSELPFQRIFNAPDFPMALGENSTAFATDSQSVVAFNVNSSSSLWGYSPANSIIAATSGGGLVVNSAQGLVSLDPSGAPTPSPGTTNSGPAYWSLGNWLGILNTSAGEFSGPTIDFALSDWPLPQGNRPNQNSASKPTIDHFVPASTSDLGIASYNAFSAGMTDLVPRSKATHVFYMGTNATPEGFLATLDKPIDAVGFVGHSFDIAATPNFSVGLQFSTTNSALVRPPSPTDNPQYSITGTNLRLVTVTQIKTQTKLVFIGACFTGSAFESLWNIHNATNTQPATLGKAMIVLSNPSSTVLLGHALVAWERILDDMVNKRMNVGNAVKETDKYLPTISVPEQYTVIGDQNVKITP